MSTELEEIDDEKVDDEKVDPIGELRNSLQDINTDIIDKVLEFLMDQDCLNEKGKNLRHHFWERYLKIR